MKVETCTTVHLAVPKISRQEIFPTWPTPFLWLAVGFCASSSLNVLELSQLKGAYTSLHGL